MCINKIDTDNACFDALMLQDVMYYEQLKAGVLQHDLLVDSLIYKVHSSALTLFTRLIKLDIKNKS